MKKTLIYSVLAASLLLGVGCSDQTKEKAKETARSAAQDLNAGTHQAVAKVSKTMEEAKQKAAEALEKAKAESEKLSQKVAEQSSQMKEAAAKTSRAVEETKQKAVEMLDEAKKAGAKAAEVVEHKAAEVKESLTTERKKTDETSAASTTAASAADGAALFAKCAGCHGADGKTKALGKAPILAGQSQEKILGYLKGYKAGTRNAYGMGALMKGQVASLSDIQLEALAAYIATLK
ncbi:c-type cytochrome [Nitratifractor sp.]